MIKPIYVGLLSSDQFYTLVKNTLNAIQSSNIEDSLKASLTQRIQEEMVNYEHALMQGRKNPLTQVLETKDNIRAERFSGFKHVVKSLTYHWDANIKTAAGHILSVIDRHGWSLNTEGYAKESALLNSLIGELESETNQAHINTLQLNDWLGQLKTAQSEFEETSLEKDKIDAVEKPRVATSKKTLYNHFMAVLKYIDGQYDFNPNGALNY